MPVRRDYSRLTPERRELADRYTPFAMGLARPFCRSWPHLRGDFRGEAGLALSESAEAWESPRGVLFTTFAGRRIVGACRDVQRQALLLGWRSHPGKGPKLVPWPRSFTNKYWFLGRNPETTAEGVCGDADAFGSWTDRLPPRHAEVCRLIYALDMSQHEAARVLGMGQSSVSRLHAESMTILARPRLAEPA